MSLEINILWAKDTKKDLNIIIKIWLLELLNRFKCHENALAKFIDVGKVSGKFQF